MIVNSLAGQRKSTLALWLALTILAGTAGSSHAAYYQVGQVVTNFILYTRTSWTNWPGFFDGVPIRLQDFAGKILFVEFLDPT